MIKVLIHPKDPNPYQSLLYDNLSNIGVTSTYFYDGFLSRHAFILGLPLLYLRLFLFRLRGYTIFHIHWTYAFVIPLPNKRLSQFISFFHAIFFILSVKLFGYKLIWTVHDILPHQKETTNDVFVSKFLSKLCDKKIILYPSETEQMKSLNIDTSNCIVIPHGNYIHHYPNTISKESARKKLGITNHEFVFLYFGIIDTYKGVPDLLEAFSELKEKNIKLIIAGKCINPDIKNKIETYKNDRRIITKLEKIPDDEIQIYMNSSDVVVLPFRKISNSGSFILASTFGKVIISPRIGSLRDLPSNTALFYNPETSKLADMLNYVINNSKRMDNVLENNQKYFASLDWALIAEETKKLY